MKYCQTYCQLTIRLLLSFTYILVRVTGPSTKICYIITTGFLYGRDDENIRITYCSCQKSMFITNQLCTVETIKYTYYILFLSNESMFITNQFVRYNTISTSP